MDLIFAAARKFFQLRIDDVKLAASVLECEKSLIIMLCGTAGTGKSTLASLLGQRLGISNVLSTDSLRHALRCTPAPAPAVFTVVHFGV
jgi:2-phosphoglycerate kinase